MIEDDLQWKALPAELVHHVWSACEMPCQSWKCPWGCSQPSPFSQFGRSEHTWPHENHLKILSISNQSFAWLNPTFYHLKMIPPRASRFSPRHDEWLSNKPRSLSNTLQKYFSFFKICLLTILFHIHSYCKVDYCFWTDPDFKSRRHNTFCLLFRELSIYRLLIQEARNDSRENCLDIKFLLSGLWFPYSSKNCQ